MDEAVRKLIREEIHVAVAAGDDSEDAILTSPTRVAEAIVVGASDFTDIVYHSSNFGPLLDVFAPGSGIPTANIGSKDATTIAYGSSMAAPHVSGLAAVLICREGNLTPAKMSQKITGLALRKVLRPEFRRK